MTTSLFLPRGIRNNNPGNIRRGAQAWLGQSAAQADPDFVTFDTPLMGLRALMKLFLTYRRKYGLDTVQSLVNRFAPPAENATDHYIHAVCRALGVKRRETINVDDAATLVSLARAVTRHENGAPPPDRPGWFPDALYAAAATLALKETP